MKKELVSPDTLIETIAQIEEEKRKEAKKEFYITINKKLLEASKNESRILYLQLSHYLKRVDIDEFQAFMIEAKYHVQTAWATNRGGGWWNFTISW